MSCHSFYKEFQSKVDFTPTRFIEVDGATIMDIPGMGDDNSNDKVTGGYGLTDEALEDICFQQHEAINEFEGILVDLFPDFYVSRLPEAVTPLTENAPVHGCVFQYHIDADPNLNPPSP